MSAIPFPLRPLKRVIHGAALSLSLSAAFGSLPALAAGLDGPAHHYQIAPGPLGAILSRVAVQAGIALSFQPALTDGLNSPGLLGNFTPQQALNRLLAGSGLVLVGRGDGSYSLEPQPEGDGLTLNATNINASQVLVDTLPPTYSGGQVARGGRIGLLGNQDLFDTPFSLTSYTADLMENQQARTVADVIANDPSTHLINPSQGGSESFSIRGFNTGGNGAELYDGLPGLSHRRRSTIESIERVEVFKGANALLSGATGTVGGTINLVPKKPLEEALTRLSSSYESTAKGGLHADISRRFGEQQQFGARVNGTYHDGESAFENNKEQLQDLSVALDTRSERFRATAVFDYAKQQLNGGNQLFSATGAPKAPDTAKAIQQPWESVDSTFKRGLLSTEYQLTEHWSLQAAYGASDYQGYWLRTTGSGLNASGNFTQIAQQQAEDARVQSGRAALQGYFNTGPVSHKLVIDSVRYASNSGRVSASVPGYSVANSLYDPVMTARPAYGHLSRNAPKTDESINDSTAIADTLGLFDDRLLLTVGVRRQRVRLENFSASTGARTSQYDEAATTPSVALLFKATDALSLYGNYIESLEAGPTAPTTAVNAGEIFPPSKSRQVEVGAKLDLDGVGLTAALFEIERVSGMVDTSNRYNVDGLQRNRGLELSAFGELTPRLRLLGGATWIDSELLKTQRGLYDGNHAVGVPELSAVLGVEWDTPLLDKLTLGGRASYTDRQYILNDNSQAIPAYTLYSVSARYKARVASQDVTLRANIDNLFGKDYWATFSGTPGVLYLGAPRQVRVSATVDF